jgi:outer membrane protein TolC
LRNQLAVQRDALIALAGQYPDLDLETKFDLSHFTLPRDLPLVLPSKLVVQGPDIRQSESNLHAAGANIGQAARLMDTVALFQALGGGWWNRTP